MTPEGPPHAWQFDPARLQELLDLQDRAGRAGLVAQLLEMFLDGLPADLLAVEAGFDARDTAALALAAHRLAGHARNVGASPLAQRALALEDAARAGTTDSFDSAVAALRKLAAAAGEAGRRLRAEHSPD